MSIKERLEAKRAGIRPQGPVVPELALHGEENIPNEYKLDFEMGGEPSEREIAQAKRDVATSRAVKLRKRRDRIVSRYTKISEHQLKLAKDSDILVAFGVVERSKWLQNSPDHGKELLTRYCHKSGAVIGELGLESFGRLVAGAGIDDAIETLRVVWPSHTSPEWLRTDDIALATMMHVDRVGYFIYTAGLIYSPTSVKKSGLTSQPNFIYDERILADNATDTLYTVDAPLAVRIAGVRDKVAARAYLVEGLKNGSVSLELITELNYILTRIFALVSPFDLLKWNMIGRGKSLSFWAMNDGTLIQFRDTMVSLLQMIAARSLDIKMEGLQQVAYSYSQICDIKDKNDGLLVFKDVVKRAVNAQKRAKRDVDQNKLTMLALQGFVTDEIGESGTIKIDWVDDSATDNDDDSMLGAINLFIDETFTMEKNQETIVDDQYQDENDADIDQLDRDAVEGVFFGEFDKFEGFSED